ncbi:CvpA family protein [Ruminococcus sp.]|uniref:CvpA family protein n=1 Tax=Ruminococcus sp. TaxID=41978 RepID=UPI00388DB65C
MIFDIFLIAVFILLIIINIRRGALRALAGVLASLISLFASTALGTVLAETVYTSLFYPAISKSIVNAVSEKGADVAGKVADSLPKWLSGVLDAAGGDVAKILEQPIANAGDSVAKAVDTAIRPIAISLLTFCITLVLFLIFFIILRFLIAKPLQKVAELPVINGINRFFGALIGLLEAFLIVSMAAYLIKLVLSHSGSQFGWFSESTIYNSFIFYHFYSGNIFIWISSLFIGR